MKRDKHCRSGTVLVCVLACCLTAISLGAAAIQMGLRSARESKQTLRLRQTQWLLQAGVQRARQQLTDPDYSGEVWSLPLIDSLGTEPRIVIVVAPNGSAASQADRGAENIAENTAGDAPEEVIEISTEDPAEESGELAQQRVELRVSVTVEYGGRAGGEPPLRRSHAFLFWRPATQQ